MYETGLKFSYADVVCNLKVHHGSATE